LAKPIEMVEEPLEKLVKDALNYDTA